MAQYDGSIRIGTKINTDGIERGFSSIKTSADKFKSSINQGMSTLGNQITNINGKIKNMGSRMRKEVTSTKRSVDGLSGSFRNLSSAIISAFAVKKVAGIATSFTELGSDLEEVQNVVDVTFTTMSDKVDSFAKSAAKSAGLSETMAKRYVGTFGAMSRSFGFAEDAALGMSTALTQLAGDVASFYNISQDEAYTKLKSVFTGETETLKDLGVVMTENALNSYAMAKGIGKTVSKMTEQEKVALRYQFVLEKLSGASGDFVRTQDSWANQTRILKLQIESLKATIGQGLINVFTPLLKMLNTLLEKLRSVANAFKSFTESFFGKSSAGGSNAGAGYVDTAEDIAGSLEDVSDAAQDAEKSLEGYLSPLDEINKYETGKDDDLLSGLEDIDFGQLGDIDIGVTVTPEIDDSALSDKFAQMAEKVKSVLQSLFNPLKEAWDREGQFVMDSWKYALGEVWGLIKDIGRDFLTVWQQEATISIFQDILHIFGDIGLIVGNLAAKFREAWNANNVGLHILENIRDIFAVIIHNIREAADYTVEWTKTIDFMPLLRGVERLTASLVPFFDFLSGTLADFYTQFLLPLASWRLSEAGIPRLLNVLADFMESVNWEGLRGALKNLYGALEPYAEAVGTGLIDFIERMKEYGVEFLNFLPEHINAAADALRSGDLKTAFEEFGMITGEAVKTAFNFIKETIEGINWGEIGTLIASFINGIDWQGVGDALFSSFTAIINAAIDLVYNFITTTDWRSLGEALGTSLSNALMSIDWAQAGKTVGEAFKAFFNFIAETLENIDWYAIGEKVKEFLVNIDWNSVADAFFEAFGAAIGGFAAFIWGIIEEAWNDVVQWWHDVAYEDGEFTIQGLLDGIVEALKNIGSWIKEHIFEPFIKGFKNAFGIHSPSTVMSEMGKYIIEGLLNGLKNTWSSITLWIEEKVRWIINKFKGVGDIIKGAFSGGGKSGQNYSERSYSMRSISAPYAVHPAIAKLSDVEIPGYATGQVIPRTMKKHLAILGDNSRETEVVSPLSTIRQAQKESLIEALSELGLTGGGFSNNQPIIIKWIADGKELTNLVINNGKIQQMSSGNNPFLLGTT